MIVFKYLYILTGWTFLWNICGLEITDDIGTIFSIRGVDGLDGADFGCVCSWFWSFSDKGEELVLERRGRGDGGGFSIEFCRGGGDGCFSTFFSRGGGGGGDGCFSTYFSRGGGGDGCFSTLFSRGGGGGAGSFSVVFFWGGGDGCFSLVFCWGGVFCRGSSFFNGDLDLGRSLSGDLTGLGVVSFGVGDRCFSADCSLANGSCFDGLVTGFSGSLTGAAGFVSGGGESVAVFY